MKKNMVVILLALALSSCVTINIYFPAAAAQEAADKIIDDVWQIKQGASKPSDVTTSDTSSTEVK